MPSLIIKKLLMKPVEAVKKAVGKVRRIRRRKFVKKFPISGAVLHPFSLGFNIVGSTSHDFIIGMGIRGSTQHGFDESYSIEREKDIKELEYIIMEVL